MPKIKLTKTAVDAATPQERDYDLQDTTIPGFLVKVTPAGRKIFMVAYVAHNGQRRKPAIGRYGEITVEQARGIAQDWLAEVRRGVDPSAEHLQVEGEVRRHGCVGGQAAEDAGGREHAPEAPPGGRHARQCRAERSPGKKW